MAILPFHTVQYAFYFQYRGVSLKTKLLTKWSYCLYIGLPLCPYFVFGGPEKAGPQVGSAWTHGSADGGCGQSGLCPVLVVCHLQTYLRPLQYFPPPGTVQPNTYCFSIGLLLSLSPETLPSPLEVWMKLPPAGSLVPILRS